MSHGAPAPPTITINASAVPAPAPSSALGSTPVTAISSPPTSARPQKPVLVKTCYLCDEQNPGDFSPTTKFLETCLLCSRNFCPIHRSESWDQVCNINHASYYHECLDKAREELDAQGRGTEGNKRALAEQLINEGIYPSLGEREKAIFSTSPVTDEKMHEIEQFRSLDAALTGSKGKKGQPVEEVDIVGADIAV
ncbi:hypothetical protein PV05_08856 [Exophiala xenobiotica]|uniref:Uncharacterized protein n=1 Tax=Exophiala xenobiotica TaxID=348802 RepID=A0A0D2CTA0_9EURO|nr:uncharacterized protein PV05_08856 [Exophiala xenobiotica]KIW53267.1 hypothetical protein PV05_08856 [Exophiala xenobiotica]